MNNRREATTYRRINITLPSSTIQTLDRLTEKGERSLFVDQAVKFYVKESSRSNVRKQLKAGASSRARRDLALAE